MKDKNSFTVDFMQNDSLEKCIEAGIERVLLGLFKTIAAIFILSWIFYWLSFWKDNTDPPLGRSGLEIKVDNLTGCQYLQSRRGLTPRLGKDGKQLCEDVANEIL